MKDFNRFMLIASLMLFASAVFADHAPPNQLASVSISCYDVPSFANIAACNSIKERNDFKPTKQRKPTKKPSEMKGFFVYLY